MNKLYLCIICIILLSGCKPAEFTCEDNGGFWVDEKCIETTTDASFICSDNTECDGYCYTTKHPKAISDDQVNGFPIYGVCSSHYLPLGCAKTIETQQIVEFCRE